MSHHDSFSPEYQGSPPAVIYYTCPWTVTPAAKDQLEGRFNSAIKALGLNARLSYDHDKHFFKIDCLQGEKAMVYRMFAPIVDIFLSNQVGSTVEKESALVKKIGPIPFGVRSDAAEASDDILLEGFMKTEWSCPRIEQLGGLFSTKLLRQIGELTECNLTYNSESRMITVVGPYQEACHAAILKLDKVRDYEVLLHNNPFPNQAHLFYAEDHTVYCLAPTPISAMNTRYENTLLDISAYPITTYSPYQALAQAATLRCALYHDKRHVFRALPIPKKPGEAIKGAHRGAEYKAFKNHKFAAKGSVDPLVGVVEDFELMEDGEVEAVIPFEKKAGIENWVRGVEGDGKMPEDVKTGSSPLKDTMGENRQLTVIAGGSSTGSMRKKNRSNSPVRTAIAAVARFIPAHLRRATPAHRGSILDMDINDDLPQALQPLPLKSTAVMAPTAPTDPVKPSSDLATTTLTKPIIETLQRTPEPSTRTYHHTTLHAPSLARKGSWIGGNFIRADPPPRLPEEFVTSLHGATTPLLHALRGFRGRAKLEVKTGRIWIVDGVMKLSEPDAKGEVIIEPARLARWLESGRKAEMGAIVTQEAGDVEGLVGMKLFELEMEGMFWKQKPRWGVEWRVEGGERCLGELWVHCLKRAWDFKVCASGRQAVDGEYKEWAEELVDGLYVPPDRDTTNLALSFSLPPDHALSFPTIRVARKCTYSSTTGSVNMHITSMHDLLVSRVGTSANGDIIYRASSRKDRGDSHQEAGWFEVSFSGKEWEEGLGQEVEVGGERNLGDE
ncbi:hypothetical protein V497_02312, partial [Pseudogymnoascus sp. VKM F-4516 (FW-969)]